MFRFCFDLHALTILLTCLLLVALALFQHQQDQQQDQEQEQLPSLSSIHVHSSHGTQRYKHLFLDALLLPSTMPPIEKDVPFDMGKPVLRHQHSASSDHGRALIPM